MSVATPETTAEDLHYCTIHPEAEATLRCNKCDRWMCIKCAVQTPVGYRCRECVRGLEDRFFNAGNTDYVLTGVIAGFLGMIGGAIGAFGGLFIAIIAGVPAGGLISQAIRYATEKRRGRYTPHIAAAATFIGAALPGLFFRGGFIGALLFGALAAGAVWAAFKMWKN
jgi:hypothetical protein